MIPSRAIESARSASFEEILSCRGVKLTGRAERVGPCPLCGGTDRFAVNLRKQVFNCRGCGAKGADAIALVQFLDGCDFKGAVEALVGPQVQTTPSAP